MSYAALLDELESLQKAMGDDDADEKVAAAAEGDDIDNDEEGVGSDEDQSLERDGGPQNDGGDTDDDTPPVSDEDEDEDDEGEDDESMVKSFNVQVDGKEVRAVDGTEMVKALQKQVTQIQKDRATESEQLVKSFEKATEMLKSQSESIKSLEKQIERLSGDGRGRRSVTSPNADALKKSLDFGAEPVTGEALLAKCETAFRDGNISAMDIAVAEASINRGMALPANIANQIK